MNRIERAVISVSDKAGVVDLAKGLRHLGVEIVSTGGTARIAAQGGHRHHRGLGAHRVPGDAGRSGEDPAPGRVRRDPGQTGQARPHGPVENMDLKRVDLVVVNLYPFKETVLKDPSDLEEIIENIDIGGPSLIRAAAKNYRWCGGGDRPEQLSRHPR